MSLNIAVRIFDEVERERVISLIEIIQPLLDKIWTVSNCQAAQVVIIDASEPGSENFLLACKQSCRALPIVYAMKNDLGAEFFLSWPVKAGRLVGMLNSLGSDLSKKAGPKSVTSSAVHIPDSAHLPQVAEKLIDLMDSQPGITFIELGGGELIFNAEDSCFYALPETMVERFLPDVFLNCSIGDIQNIKTKAMSKEAFSDIYDQLLSVNGKRLLWTAHLYYSDGRLTNELTLEAVVRLNSWPDLTHLPHQPVHSILAANLLRGGYCINKLSQDLRIPQSTVNNFINACFSLGLIDDVGQQRVERAGFIKGRLVETVLQKLLG